MKKIVQILIISISVFTCNIYCLAQEKSDAVSGATATYSEKLPNTELFQLIKEYKEPMMFATTNADGTPNVALMSPKFINENVIMYDLSYKSLSRKNITERKHAVLVVCRRYQDEESGKMKNKGGRVFLRLIEDKAKIEELIEEAEVKEKAVEYVLFLEITKIIPLS